MLAYSTIAHVGLIFVAVTSGTPTGYAASMFYVLAYSLMALSGFAMVIWLGRAGAEADRLDDFKGLNERNPWFAFYGPDAVHGRAAAVRRGLGEVVGAARGC